MIIIGLGVGIDYALFVVTRYRQGLAEQRPPRDATIVALAMAGRSVLFAGATVVIALLGLFVVGMPSMDGMAAAAIVAVALVLVAALTLLPAIFGFAGRSIDRLHIPGLLARPGATTGRGFWNRWSATVQKRPWACAAAALAVLTVLAVPLFSMRQAFSDAGNDPPSLTTRQAYNLLADGFGPGFNGPLIIAADLHGPPCASHYRPDRRAPQPRARRGLGQPAGPQRRPGRRGDHHLPNHRAAVRPDRLPRPPAARPGDPTTHRRQRGHRLRRR
jgi:putative drug exporter of the RND superfamily